MSFGVPPLYNQIANVLNIITLVTADAILVIRQFQAPVWGIYKTSISSPMLANFFPVIEPDSIVSIDYEKEWAVANYPIEQGKFATYNKVNTPYHNAVCMTFSGHKKGLGSLIPSFGPVGVSAKTEALVKLEAMAASLELYDIVTPERIYTNANIMGINYRRDAEEGACMLVVEVVFVEVLITAESSFSTTKNPNSANPTNNGDAKTTTGSVNGTAQ
jgi:hypothetical protein